ncbi:MAG: DUF2089 domain-containing protein [Phycisphaerae bacterium]|nr:DUF2089 domain-containing protein [Phycisphaerae bacterium]
MADTQRKRWIDLVSDEDLAFIKRFVLASGSLKEMAGVYGITYPTIRLRLDRLIEKIKVIDAYEQASGFERLLRSVFAEGRLDQDTFRTLLQAYREQAEDGDEK